MQFYLSIPDTTLSHFHVIGWWSLHFGVSPATCTCNFTTRLSLRYRWVMSEIDLTHHSRRGHWSFSSMHITHNSCLLIAIFYKLTSGTSSLVTCVRISACSLLCPWLRLSSALSCTEAVKCSMKPRPSLKATHNIYAMAKVHQAVRDRMTLHKTMGVLSSWKCCLLTAIFKEEDRWGWMDQWSTHTWLEITVLTYESSIVTHTHRVNITSRLSKQFSHGFLVLYSIYFNNSYNTHQDVITNTLIHS